MIPRRCSQFFKYTYHKFLQIQQEIVLQHIYEREGLFRKGDKGGAGHSDARSKLGISLLACDNLAGTSISHSCPVSKGKNLFIDASVSPQSGCGHILQQQRAITSSSGSPRSSGTYLWVNIGHRGQIRRRYTAHALTVPFNKHPSIPIPYNPVSRQDNGSVTSILY